MTTMAGFLNADAGGTPAPAVILGVAGLVPFVGLTAIAAFAPVPYYAFVLYALLGYGAVILSFVGALHWGYAVKRGARGAQAWMQYGWSVLPALAAWLSLLVPVWTGLRLQAGALVACYVFDRVMGRYDPNPRWLLRLRAALTVVAAVSLTIASLV